MDASWAAVLTITSTAIGLFNLAVIVLKMTSAWGKIKKLVDPIRVTLGGLLALGVAGYLNGETPEMLIAVSTSFAGGSWIGHKALKKKEG